MSAQIRRRHPLALERDIALATTQVTVQPIPFLHRRFQTASTDWLTRTIIFTLTLPGYQQSVINRSLIATITLRVHRAPASSVHCTSFVPLQCSFPAAEESSGRLIRTPMVDEEIDYDSMLLRSKNELLQPPQLELRDEPKDSKDPKKPTYSFAGPSAEDSLPSVEESEKSGNLPSLADSPPDDDSFSEGSYDEESSDPSLPSTRRSEPAGKHSTVSHDAKKSLKRSITAGVSETGNAPEKAVNYTPVSTTVSFMDDGNA